MLHIGGFDWTKINPDIFGSIIQAVTEDEERGALGMHYTSVPNLLKVINPLFLMTSGKSWRKPAIIRALCSIFASTWRRFASSILPAAPTISSSYKQMGELEAEINRRRGEPDIHSEIPLTNFRGIELWGFPVEIARLALVIAEYQSDFRGQKLALAKFLPLRAENWITCVNALRLDWLTVCPPTGTGVKLQETTCSVRH